MDEKTRDRKLTGGSANRVETSNSTGYAALRDAIAAMNARIDAIQKGLLAVETKKDGKGSK